MEALRFGSPVPRTDRGARTLAELEDAFRRGDLRAGERLAARLESDPETIRDARPVLERILRQDPGRIDSLHAMWRVTEAIGDRVAASAVASVLGLFDSGAPRRRPGSFARIPTPSRESLAGLLPRRAAILEEIFGYLWTACPALAGPGEPAGVVLAREDVLAVHAHAIRMLRLQPVRLLAGDEGSAAVPVPARRPTIRVGPALDLRSRDGAFLLGRALFSTRPGIAAALAPSRERAIAIHEAVCVAFAPSRERRAEIGDEAGELVRALWSLPLPAQRHLQSLCAHGVLGTPEEWQLAMRQAANRAGLLVSENAAAALRLVASERIRGFDPGSPAAFRAAVDASRDFADLAGFAVSAEYLAMRS